MKKKFSLLMVALLSIVGLSFAALRAGETSLMIQFADAEDNPVALSESFSAGVSGEFVLTRVDVNNKHAIDANNAWFGDATAQQKFTARLKTGGKSSSNSSMTLTIPAEGTLKVYVRTGSNNATDRTLILTQGETELYNKVVQESDAVEVDMGGEALTKVYPIISVPVVAGTVAVAYPVNGLNFYGFEFVPAEQEAAGPEKFYIMGNGTPGGWDATTEMTYNAETKAFEYELTNEGTLYFTFGDAEFTGWDDFNANHRYAIGVGDQDAAMGTAMQLQKVNGTLVLSEAGKFLVSVTKDLQCTITKQEDVVITDVDYFLVGTFNEWAQKDENYKLAKNEAAEVEEYSITLDLAAGTEFKVISSTDAWYPAGSDNNLSVQAAGNYTIYFRPVANDEWGGNIYVQANSTEQLNTYTAKFENNGNWAEVYAYTYSMDEESNVTAQELGAWPGKKIEATDEGYIVTIEAAAAPQFIIFNNGVEGEGAVQTEDLVFEDGKTYTYEAPAAPATDVMIELPEGSDIYAGLAAAETDIENIGNISIKLAAGQTYTVSAPLVAYKSFEIQANGATIDASELSGNLIEMAATAEVPAEAVQIEYVSIHNATIKGLKKPLFYSTQKGYLINWLTIDNSIIELAADATTIDFTKGSAARSFNIENSTIYAPVATTKSFYSSQAGQKLTELDEEGIQTFIVKNSTMYNLAYNKNFFTHRQSNQKWLAYDVENSIFVNCGKSGQVIKGMNGGQSGSNPTWTINGNVFNFEADGVMTDTSAAEDTGDTTEGEGVQNSYAIVMTFKDAANGDFNADFTKSAEDVVLPTEKIGDPRWTLNYKQEEPAAPDYFLVGNFNVAEDGTTWTLGDEAYKLAKNEEAEGVVEYMITVDLPANTELKVWASNDTWYPAGENFTINDAGNYTIYFRPNADGGEGWYEGVIYCQNNTKPAEGVIPNGQYYVMNTAYDSPHLFINADQTVSNEGSVLNFVFDAEKNLYTIFSGELQVAEMAVEQVYPDLAGYYYLTIVVEGQKFYVTTADNRLTATNDPEAEGTVWAFIYPEAKPYFYNYTVAGAVNEEASFFGVAWDATNDANDLELDKETMTFSKTFKNVTLEAGTTILYKVVRDRSWDYASWGMDKDNGNAEYVVNEAGTYDITFKFNPVAKFDNNWNVDCQVAIAVGINTVKADNLKDAQIFNLAGQRVQSAQKGLYIVNGKKVVVK